MTYEGDSIEMIAENIESELEMLRNLIESIFIFYNPGVDLRFEDNDYQIYKNGSYPQVDKSRLK